MTGSVASQGQRGVADMRWWLAKSSGNVSILHAVAGQVHWRPTVERPQFVSCDNAELEKLAKFVELVHA